MKYKRKPSTDLRNEISEQYTNSKENKWLINQIISRRVLCELFLLGEPNDELHGTEKADPHCRQLEREELSI